MFDEIEKEEDSNANRKKAAPLIEGGGLFGSSDFIEDPKGSN